MFPVERTTLDDEEAEYLKLSPHLKEQNSLG
jgi:hypothetical protein